jgi:hypothetical protein
MTLEYPMFPPPRAATRRDFLAQAAAVATGSAVLGVATVSPGAAKAAPAWPLGSPDPIFAAIEAHRTARVDFEWAVEWHGRLEEDLPKDRSQSRITALETKIIDSDDAQWIACERLVDATTDVETDAGCALVAIAPTTMAGVVALLQYVVAADTDGEMWGADMEDDEGRGRSWHHFLIEMLADVLPELMKGGVAGMVRT